MDQYLSSVHEVEKRMLAAEDLEMTPKPEVDGKPPEENGYLLDRRDSMNRLIKLSLQTDSTRLISMLVKCDGFSGRIPGVKTESHNLSHQVNRKDKLQELRHFQTAQFASLAGL